MAQKKYTKEEARERKNARQREYAKRTGFKSNNEYNKRTYTQIIVRERNEIAEEYKEICDSMGISYSTPLHEAIANFIKNNKKHLVN